MRLHTARNISFKLPAMILIMVGLAVWLASATAYFQQRQTLQQAAEDRMRGATELRAAEVEDYFRTVAQDLVSTAKRSSSKRAIMGFERAWKILDDAEISELRRLYVAENEFAAGERLRTDSAGDSSTWTTVHAQMHPEFRDILELGGYGDIYLIDADGRVIYSVAKWDDFGTDLTQPATADSALAQVFAQAIDLPRGETAFQDFAPYAAAGGVRAGFLATPMFSTSGQTLGVLVYQLRAAALSEILASSKGLGQTFSTFLLGPDGQLRAGAQGQPGPGGRSAGSASAALPAIERALAGDTGVTEVARPDGARLLASFLPLDVFGQQWALVAQQDAAEILSSVSALGKLLLWGALGAIALTALIGVLFARRLTRPLWRVVSVMQQIARGKYAIEVPDRDRRDEIGAIASALEDMRAQLDLAERETRENTFRGVAFEATSAAIMMADADMVITSINPALVSILDQYKHEFEKMFPGFDAQGMVGTKMDFYHPEEEREQIREMLRDPENLPYLANISVAEARFSLRISMVQEADGTPMGYVVEWLDVTREFLNTAILNAIDNSQVKAEFDKHGMFISANRKFADMMGGDVSQLEGRHGAEIFSFDEEIAAQRGAVFDRLQRGETITGVFELPRSAGDAAIVEGSFSPVLDANGRLLRILLLGNDVTEARIALQAADARREAMRLEQAEVVKSLGLGLGRLAEGDLTARIDTEFGPEYEQLRADFNMTGEHLLEAMRAVVENADLIRGEASEIANAADDLLARTERQAATLEQTASALDQLTSSVSSAADGADIANQLVQSARENAEASGDVVREAVEAMSAIEGSSQKIASITDVIDDIAFQTNLLALNAGVEAARAGDAGRGFAVVASEVRALAQRSSDAAREINDLISESGDQVKRGVNLVGQTGSALAAIVENVSEINQKVSEIAVSSREQSVGLSEINEAVNQLDQVTQQNAAMFEQTTAASHALTREAETLTETTSRFKIGSAQNMTSPANVVAMDCNAIAERPGSQCLHPPASSHPPVETGNLAAHESEPIEKDWDDF